MRPRKRVWPLVLGTAALAGLLGYLLARPSLTRDDVANDPPTKPAPEPEPPAIRETATSDHRNPADPAEPSQATTSVELHVSPPAAEVHVDGRLLAGPPYTIELGDTRRELAVRLDGHHEQIMTLDGRAPPSSPLTITLAPLELGSLSVLAPTVAWAEVWLDGSKLGTTPLTDKPVLEGKHKLEVRCTAAVCGEDRSLLQRSVRIKPGRENRFTVE
jgi:hypothetical protein